MGCFNETCLISNLPIMNGQKVTMILLQPKDKAFVDGILCHSNHYADPAPVPFYGQYNDYGSVEEYHGPAMDILVDEIKNILVEKQWGDNTSHDIPVSKANFDMDQLLEASRESRLEVKMYGKPTTLQYAFIHDCVMDKILNDYRIDACRFKDNIDKKSIYHRFSYGFKSIVRDIPAYVERFRNQMKELNNDTTGNLRLKRIFSRTITSELYSRDELNVAAMHLNFDSNEMSNNVIFNPSDYIVDHADDMTDEQLVEFLTEVAKIQWLKRFMNDANKMWIKPMTSGQDGSTQAHSLIVDATNDFISAQKLECDNSDEEYVNETYPKKVNLDDNPGYALQFSTDDAYQ